MMVEEPNSPQEQSPSQIIEGVRSSVEPETSEVTVVPLELEEEIRVVKVVDEVLEDLGLKVQVVGTHQSRE